MRDEAIDLCGQVDFTRTDAMPLLERDTQFRFACAGCGDCCRQRRYLVLSGYDLYRIARRLSLPPRIVAAAFCKSYLAPESCLPALRLTPVRETTASVPLAVAERSLAALPIYGGLLGTLCALFGWSALWPAMAAGAAALALAVWCAMSRGWRQWLPALLALAAAAWCLLLPQARDSAAGLINGLLAYVK